MSMKATWDKKTGRVTFDDERYIVLTGEDATDFNTVWSMIETLEAKKELLQKLIRSKFTIHYPRQDT